MWIDGKNYKSLNFTLLKDKLLSGKKTQTCRILFIPSYKIGEIIAICFEKEFLFLAEVTDLYPKPLSSLMLTEALKDGFGSIKEFQDTVMALNNINDLDHWSFITLFKKIPNVFDYIGKSNLPIKKS